MILNMCSDEVPPLRGSMGHGTYPALTRWANEFRPSGAGLIPGDDSTPSTPHNFQQHIQSHFLMITLPAGFPVIG
jgi:hypothetical protein